MENVWYRLLDIDDSVNVLGWHGARRGDVVLEYYRGRNLAIDLAAFGAQACKGSHDLVGRGVAARHHHRLFLVPQAVIARLSPCLVTSLAPKLIRQITRMLTQHGGESGRR